MAHDEAKRDDRSELPSSPRNRRPYAKPRLIEYGSVAKLTQGTLTRQADSPGAGFKMSNPCL
jgi:hypothetical protein